MFFSAIAALFGTLIVAAPTADGLVVAADSRDSSKGGYHCDLDTKIRDVQKVDRTIIAVAGLGAFSRNPHPPSYYCIRHQMIPRIFDMRDEFSRFVSASGKTAASISISSFLPKLREVLSEQRGVMASLKKDYAGKNVAVLMVGSFDDKTATSTLRYAYLQMTQKGELVIQNENIEQFSPASTVKFAVFGEAPYAARSIADGTLAKLFSYPTTAQLLFPHPTVSSVNKLQAAYAETDLISAVSKRMETLPSENPLHVRVTVGGPIDVVLLGADARPEHLQWKNPRTTLAPYKPDAPPVLANAPVPAKPSGLATRGLQWSQVPIPTSPVSATISPELAARIRLMPAARTTRSANPSPLPEHQPSQPVAATNGSAANGSTTAPSATPH